MIARPKMTPSAIHYGRNRYHSWRNEFCDEVLNLDAPRKPPSVFSSAARVRPLGGGLVTDILHDSGEFAVGRDVRRVARSNPFEYGLVRVVSGTTTLEVRGGELCLAPGDLALIHRGDPF